MRPSPRPTVHDSLRSWSRRNRMRAETRRMFAAHIFVWIRRLAYRIDGARLGIVRCWGLSAVGGLGLICWLACCFFFRWKGLSCFSGSTLSIVFWFSPVSSLSHHQDICYTEYVHIKIMKEETNGTHHRRTTRNQRPRPRHPRHPRSHLHLRAQARLRGHQRLPEKLDGTLPTVPQLPVQARQGIRRKAVCRNQLTRTPRDVAQRNPSY